MNKGEVSKGLLIGIDGPSGSGKSTVSKRVATQLGLTYLDTGAMYRSLTWLCMEGGVDLTDPEAIVEVADKMAFSSRGGAEKPRFFVGDQEVTDEIRSTGVAANVSTVAKYPTVRSWMAKEQGIQMQHARQNGTGMVAEGRDVTTVVCPDADIRVLLVADPAARLRRRTMELYGEVTAELLAQTEVLVHGRDEQDGQVSSFLDAAEGVTTIDSSDLLIEEVVDKIVAMAVELDRLQLDCG